MKNKQYLQTLRQLLNGFKSLKALMVCVFFVIEGSAYAQGNCADNGGFESGLSIGNYSFANATGGFVVGNCAISTAAFTSVTTPIPLNDFNASFSLVTAATEPTLQALGITTVSTTMSGNSAIKLNASPSLTLISDNAVTDMAAVSKTFTATNQNIDFDFSIVAKDGNHQLNNPFFTARLYDDTGNIINTNSVCIQTNPNNCIFNVGRVGIGLVSTILYTGWRCARIVVPQQYIGKTIRLEFLMSDCGASFHNGTVYIDNICTSDCANPVFGSLNLDPIDQNCPTQPFNVCGTYQLPLNSTLGTIALDVVQNNTVIMTYPAPVSSGSGTFCFTVDPASLPPTGIYRFVVNAVFNVSCTTSVFDYNISDASEPDALSFENCCVPTLISSGTITGYDPQERSVSIVSTNIFDGTAARGIYHAGNWVTLEPGFETINNAQFSAYIDGCPADFDYKYQANANNNVWLVNPGEGSFEKETLHMHSDNFAVFPNPSEKHITVSYSKSMRHIKITALDGKTIFTRNANENEMQIDVSTFVNGMYLITVETQNGQFLQSKFIKN